jgi:hypothetical protein
MVVITYGEINELEDKAKKSTAIKLVKSRKTLKNIQS